MRILHIFLFSILLKNVYSCDSNSDPLPKSKASPFHVPAINTKVCKVPPQAPPASPKVTAYVLAVQWPPGVCTGNSGVQCEINPVPAEFKIHGLWPKPDVPASTETYDPNELAPMTTELNKHWPNLKSRQQQISKNLDFWKHEWNDHGRYSEMEAPQYFKKTLELFNLVVGREGLARKLAAENITPTIYKTYKLQDIEATLKKINDGFSCTVVCNERNTSKKEKQIQEIRFRFTKDFKKQDNAHSPTCGTATTDVMFPLMQ